MQQFKTGNLDYSTPLGRACGVIGFITGSLIIVIVEITLRLSEGYKLIEHQIPFLITFVITLLLPGSIFHYIYHNKKRCEYIRSAQYPPFKFTNTIGFTICTVVFALSFMLMVAVTVFANDYI